MIQPLVDADILLYECGFAAEAAYKEERTDERPFPQFDKAAEILDNRIANICAMTEATQPPILFLTGQTNFRNDIAITTKYKERPGHKPFHYYNLKAYIKGKYDYRITEGLEADDLMAIEQTSRPLETIICTRDKDLRAVPGWHYGWELGNQPQFGPLLVDEAGEIRLSSDRKSIKGFGKMFFYAQMLTGDRVDSVPGIDGMGAVGAFKILEHSKTPNEALKAVYRAYKTSYGMSGYKRMIEQGILLHMTRKLKPNGQPYLWGQTY